MEGESGPASRRRGGGRKRRLDGDDAEVGVLGLIDLADLLSKDRQRYVDLAMWAEMRRMTVRSAS